MILFSDNLITARHGKTVAGLPVSCTPTTFPAFCRLCAVLRPAGGIFAPVASRAGETPKSKIAAKAVCRPATAFYTLMAIPIFTHRKTSHRSRQRPAHGIKQPRPALSGASRGIVICCGRWIAPRSALFQRPTRRSGIHCTKGACELLEAGTRSPYPSAHAYLPEQSALFLSVGTASHA